MQAAWLPTAGLPESIMPHTRLCRYILGSAAVQQADSWCTSYQPVTHGRSTSHLLAELVIVQAAMPYIQVSINPYMYTRQICVAVYPTQMHTLSVTAARRQCRTDKAPWHIGKLHRRPSPGPAEQFGWCCRSEAACCAAVCHCDRYGPDTSAVWPYVDRQYVRAAAALKSRRPTSAHRVRV